MRTIGTRRSADVAASLWGESLGTRHYFIKQNMLQGRLAAAEWWVILLFVFPLCRPPNTPHPLRRPSLPRSLLPSLPLSLHLSAGSLTVSITDMRAPVVGGSGGVYALCSAHLANVVMVTVIAVIRIISIIIIRPPPRLHVFGYCVFWWRTNRIASHQDSWASDWQPYLIHAGAS